MVPLGEGPRTENNMKRTILALMIFGLLVQSALADDYNPFLSEKAAKPKKEVKRDPQSQPMAPIPPPMYMQPQLPPPRIEVPDKVSTWRIAGKVGDLVPLINVNGEKLIVMNGTEKEGCLVLWPDIICNMEEKATAHRKLTEAANAKKAEESALAAQTAKIAELQKSLTSTTDEAAQLKAQVASLKSIVDTPPDWVKGEAKEYQDPVLGKAKVFSDGDKMYFRVQQGLETNADSFFGTKALKKERKGDYTYYALNANSVRVREHK